MEIEPRFSIDKLTGADLSFGPFKEWYFANNYIYDMGDNKASRQSTWYMGLGTDIDTGLPMGLSLNVYAKYQWQNYGASNENEWDGYRFKVKYFVPITDLWGGKLSYIGFTNFDWGSDLGDDPNRTSNSIASSHITALNYDHWHYSVVARYFHNGGQWQNGAKLNWGDGDFSAKSTGWGGYGRGLQLLNLQKGQRSSSGPFGRMLPCGGESRPLHITSGDATSLKQTCRNPDQRWCRQIVPDSNAQLCERHIAAFVAMATVRGYPQLV